MYRISGNQKIKKHFKKMARFGVIGAYIFIQDITLTWFFIKVLNISVIFGVTISYFLAIIAHFLLNFYFTFSHDKNRLLITIFKYLLTVSLNYILTLITVELSLSYISKSIIFAKIIAILITFVTSYLLMNIFVFKKNSKGKCENANTQ